MQKIKLLFTQNLEQKNLLTKAALLLLLVIGITCVLIFNVNFQNSIHENNSFRFESYDSNKAMMSAMQKMFPEGTSKEHVENILVRQAGASIQKVPRDFEAYSYKYTIPYLIDATWNIVFKYYPNNTVDQIWVNGSAVHQYKPFTHGRIS